MKKQILRVFLTLFAVSLILGGALTVVLAEEEPTVSIEYFALSFDNEVHIEYAVECQGFTPNKSNTGMLFWTAEPGTPEMNTEKSRAATSGTTVIDGKEHIVFRYTDLAAKQMCDEIWARAYAVVDGKVYYSNVEKYSIVTYAAHKLGLTDGVEGTKNETLKTMLREMLEYGEAAQKHFGYNLEHLPTDFLPGNSFTVTFDSDGGSAVPAQTVYRGRRAQEPTAPEKAGYTFAGWYNGDTAWTFDTDTVTADITLTAKWTPKTVTSSEGLVFTSNGDGTCTVTGFNNSTVTDLIIPETSPDGEQVTVIGAFAINRRENLKSIAIPDSVVRIESYAINYCSGLTSVSIGNGLKSVAEFAFNECNSLERVDISSLSVWLGIDFESYGANPLTYAHNLYVNGELFTELTIPDGVTGIGKYAFVNCSGLTKLVIPDSVTNIGEHAFSGCFGLTNVVIPSSVINIGEYAFSGCFGLTNIVIPDSVTNIGQYAFSDCSGITDLTISNGVTSIGERAFSGCSGLTNVVIPNSVESIGYEALYGCSNLVSITIPFVGASRYEVERPVLAYIFGGGTNVYIGNYHCIGSEGIPVSLKKVIVTGGTSIGNCAFYNCNGLESIILPASVTSIGAYAFNRCYGLTSIVLPDGLMSIDVWAFYECVNMTNITIPASVRRIGSSAFYSCYKLIEVYNKSGLEIVPGSNENGDVGYYAKAVYTGPFTSKLTLDENGYLLYIDGDVRVLVAYLGNETELNLPAGITEINQGAFYDCRKLTGIAIPESVTAIGEYAFYNCESLTHIEIPKAVTTIQRCTFYGCKSLTEIVIPEGVNRIEHSAFAYCTGLTSIVIPDSVTDIYSDVFYGCTGLTSITLPFVGWHADSNDSLSHLFGGDSNVPASLKTVVITGSTKIVANAFVGCSGLKNLAIAATVTGIGNYAFDGCSDLTITFNGTRAQWDALEKSENWATGCNGLTVRCSDDPQQTA